MTRLNEKEEKETEADYGHYRHGGIDRQPMVRVTGHLIRTKCHGKKQPTEILGALQTLLNVLAHFVALFKYSIDSPKDKPEDSQNGSEQAH